MQVKHLKSALAACCVLMAAGVSVGFVALAAGAFDNWKNRPKEPFTDGEAAFNQIFSALKERYVDADLSDDDLYRAASQGLLQYVDSKRSEWNRLYTPTEYAELQADLRGEVVGVGVAIRFDDESGMGVVIGVVDGSPAHAEKMQVGDRILQVDGRSFSGGQIRDMVYAIRGKVGSDVVLTILRSAKVFDLKLTRAPLAFEETNVRMLEDDIALVTVRSFSAKTTEKVRAGLQSLPGPQVKGLIVDLRRCHGGSFEAALSTASLFLQRGDVIARLRHRGQREESRLAEADPVIEGVPATVLIDGETSSGCELVAASLQQNIGATLVGSKTFGKWSMQTVDELPNKYAMKFTVATFLPPDGSVEDGVGLNPDVPVSGLAEQGSDPQLQTARSLLVP